MYIIIGASIGGGVVLAVIVIILMCIVVMVRCNKKTSKMSVELGAGVNKADTLTKIQDTTAESECMD